MLLSENLVNKIEKSSSASKNKKKQRGRNGNSANSESENEMDNKLSQVKTSNPCLYKKLALSRELLYSDEGLPEIHISESGGDDDTIFNEDSECEPSENDGKRRQSSQTSYEGKRRRSSGERKESGVCFSTTNTESPLLSIQSNDVFIPILEQKIPKIPSFTFQQPPHCCKDGYQLQAFTSLAFTTPAPGLAPILNVGISYGLAPLMHIGKRKVSFTKIN